MCGIAGYVNGELGRDALLAAGAAMAQALGHRGPDSNGTWVDAEASLVLAHTRLAIQDLSPLGHQPMMSQSGRYSMVFNGEIYNFGILRSELKTSGIEFRGHSDTEVLLAAIEMWGLEAALRRAKGMFAIALFDQRERVLHLIRDRIGEKPLYYALLGGKLAFASELKAIHAVIPQRPEIDTVALASYLRYGYVSAPQTIYKDIAKVEPASVVSFILDAKGNLAATPKHSRYWKLEDIIAAASENQIGDEGEAIDQLDALLNKIIKEQAISDVPLGAFLSGGIDSSTVAACLQANSSSPIDTFTIGFHEKSFNEAEHAKRIAEHIKSNHHELYVGQREILDVVPKLSTVYDEPFADSSQIPMYLVSALARSKVTVCLSGDGGDELFAGYNRYLYPNQILERSKSVPPVIKSAANKAIQALTPGTWDSLYGQANSLLRRKGGANTGSKLYKLGALLQCSDKPSAYRQLASYSNDPVALLQHDLVERDLAPIVAFENDFLSAAMAWDQKWYLPGDNLVKTDRASMAHSLEMRLPLLDQELVEFAWRVPNQMKVKDGISKWALRQVLYRYVPQNLIDRPKMGFSVPVSHWIRNELRDWSEALLAPDKLGRDGLFDATEIRKLYDLHLSGKYDYGNLLWGILMFQDWVSSSEHQY